MPTRRSLTDRSGQVDGTSGHLDEVDDADRLEAAIAGVIADGDQVTYDLKPSRDDPSAVGTNEMADAIAARL